LLASLAVAQFLSLGHETTEANMRKTTFTTKAKIGYSIAAGVFLAGIAFVLAGILSVGCILAGVGLAITFRVAVANGHYPTRRDKKD
jgi:hypothetical protein